MLDNFYGISGRQYLYLISCHNIQSIDICTFQISLFFLFVKANYRKYHIYQEKSRPCNHKDKENKHLSKSLNSVSLHTHTD